MFCLCPFCIFLDYRTDSVWTPGQELSLILLSRSSILTGITQLLQEPHLVEAQLFTASTAQCRTEAWFLLFSQAPNQNKETFPAQASVVGKPRFSNIRKTHRDLAITGVMPKPRISGEPKRIGRFIECSTLCICVLLSSSQRHSYVLY